MNLDAILTLSEAARFVGLSDQVVGMWASRGWTGRDEHGNTVRRKLTRYDHESGRTGYQLREVLEAERDTRRSSKSHRRPPASLVA